MNLRNIALAGALFGFVIANGVAGEPYEVQKNVVFAKDHGVGYLMDIYTPKKEANRKAIIHVVNGGFYSTQGLVDYFTDHVGVFDAFCSRGFTVFSVWTGSRTRFNNEDMIGKVQTAIRWAKANAEKYKVDADKFGIIGESAGGQLALMCALAEIDFAPKFKPELKVHSPEVVAVGAFVPVTDMNYIPYKDFFFEESSVERTDAEVSKQGQRLSPISYLNESSPKMYIVQSKDFLYQSTLDFVEKAKLERANVELVVVESAEHSWPEMRVNCVEMAAWFDRVIKDDSE